MRLHVGHGGERGFSGHIGCCWPLVSTRRARIGPTPYLDSVQPLAVAGSAPFRLAPRSLGLGRTLLIIEGALALYLGCRSWISASLANHPREAKVDFLGGEDYLPETTLLLRSVRTRNPSNQFPLEGCPQPVCFAMLAHFTFSKIAPPTGCNTVLPEGLKGAGHTFTGMLNRGAPLGHSIFAWGSGHDFLIRWHSDRHATARPRPPRFTP